ncbi:MAG: carbohydrate kinase family protein [Chloroflexi bacterium]|nr:carbohydrate kinase family protein [Chloroflexota bacterium]
MSNELKPLDVIAAGRGTIDLVLEVDGLPGHDQKVMGKLVGWLPGGTVANFACAASHLGLRTGFLGSVGGDQYAQIVLDDFTRFGVQTDHIERRTGNATGLTVVMVDHTGEKGVVVVPTYADPFVIDAAARAYLATARVVYSMPYALDRLRQLSDAVHAGGGRCALDIERTVASRGDNLKMVLGLCDIAFFNVEGLEAATGRDDPRAAAELLALGPDAVIVTLGARGSMAFTRTGEAAHPGFRVPVVDTTGAGDCFNAAFLRGYLHSWPLERCVTFANAAAALSVTRMGPRAAVPDEGEVEAFLARAG